MIKLEIKDFKKITHLVKSQNELSVFSVISGMNPGEIYVNNFDNPTAALIQTSECNLIAGSPKDEAFNSEVSSELDFWAPLVPDSYDWLEKIPTIHENHFIRKYKRRHYQLSRDKFVDCDAPLNEGYTLEKIDLSFLGENSFENSKKILEWAKNFGDDETFETYGTGYLIRNDKAIVSWSLSDCSYEKTIAIGIHTDERYRKNGFGKLVVAATIRDCFAEGYMKIDWLCVDSNKGSRAIAEKLGFQLIDLYDSFTSYPPIENLTDLSESEWHEWAEYLEDASKTEERLTMECVFAYVKANAVEKTIAMMTTMKQKKFDLDYSRFNNWISELQTHGMCSNFTSKVWHDFLNDNINY